MNRTTLGMMVLSRKVVAWLASLMASVALGYHGEEPIAAYRRVRIHEDLFTELDLRDPNTFDPALLPIVEAARGPPVDARKDLLDLIREEAPGIYSFPFFTESFCERFLEELDNYKRTGLPIRRPNSMNNYGIIVNEIGMRPMISRMQAQILHPIAKLLWPEVASQFDEHHTFMVQYKQGQDLGLDMHTDDSDVTFNICLGRDFQGAGLTFCGEVGEPNHRQFNHTFAHERGRAVVHLGSRRHGADDIQAGERNNLIVWNQNQAWRNSEQYHLKKQRYAKEARPPARECLSYTHDRDYEAYKALPPGTEEHRGRGWCPPNQACYDGMQAVFEGKREL